MIALSVDHRRASAHALASLRLVEERLAAKLAATPSVAGVVVLATCGRTEAYVDAARFHPARDAMREFIEDCLGLDRDGADAILVAYRGRDALAHLFSVASGLESVVVGEREITGQVGRALAEARVRATATRALGIAFERAVQASRQVRTGAGTSLVAHALQALPPARSALIVGSGEYAGTAIEALRERAGTSLARIDVHAPSGRTLDLVAWGRRVQQGQGIRQVDRVGMLSSLATVDMAVLACGKGRVLTWHDVERSVSSRRSPLVVLDMSGGIDVDDTVGRVPRVEYIGLESLRGVGPANGDGQRARIAMLADSAWPRVASSGMDELITGLRSHVEEVARRAMTGNPDVDDAVRRVTQAILHAPTDRIRGAAGAGDLEEMRQALDMVFGLGLAPVQARVPSQESTRRPA